MGQLRSFILDFTALVRCPPLLLNHRKWASCLPGLAPAMGIVSYWAMETSIEITPRSPPDRLESGGRKDWQSRVTNHADLLPGVSGRTAPARRFRDLVRAFLVDVGGLEQCSEIKLGLLRRLAATTVQAELLEARMVNGEAVDVGSLCTLASTTVRISARLGLDRAPTRRGPGVQARPRCVSISAPELHLSIRTA
jgi:hypothetical protein